MKVMVFVKATPNSEAGLLPSDEATQKMFTEMGKFNEELAKAGIIKNADGLRPSSAGKRIKFTDGHTTVIDGPFAETKELVAGFWIWEVKSVEEAVEWAKRCPNPMPGEEGVLEIRPFYEMADFDHLMTDEIREREGRVRKLVERQQKPKAKSAAKAKARSRRPSPRHPNAGPRAPNRRSSRGRGRNSPQDSPPVADFRPSVANLLAPPPSKFRAHSSQILGQA